LVPELLPEPGEAVIHKNFRSSFENTDLDAVLAEQGVAELIVCGSQTNYCVRNTVHAALERGYDVTLVSDAHTTCDEHTEHLVIPAQHIVEEFNRVSEHYELPGRQLRTVTTSSILAL
jgi:nicotinamidase-related amidase